MSVIGTLFILFGAVMICVGLLLFFFDKIPYLGKLPGDIHLRKENFEFYFPITTSLVVSILLTGVLWLLGLFIRK